MTELLHAEGFLGTHANWAADVTLLMMLLVGIIFTVGFVLARIGKYDAHGLVQTTGATINAIFVFWLMVLPFRDFVIRDLGGPRLPIFYHITQLHALLGFCALVFGIYVVLRGHGLMPKFLSFNNYKPYMRVAYGLYIAAIIAGVAVYIVWFTVLPEVQVPVYE